MDADGDIKNGYSFDGDGWCLGGQAAPLAREKLVATLAAKTKAALG